MAETHLSPKQADKEEAEISEPPSKKQKKELNNAHLNVRTICMELGKVAHNWFKIGVQLGVPHDKLKGFEKETDPLSAVINYWLNDNVEDAEVPVSWKSIVAALESSYVGETGLANRISRKYCYIIHQSEIERKGSSNPPPPESVASLAVSTTTTSSGSNSIPPVDLHPYFQYFVPDKRHENEEELSFHLNKLMDQTKEIKGVFSGLLVNLKKDMESNAKLDDVVLFLINSIKDKGFEEVMYNCKNLPEVFRHLSNFVSFFDFDLVKLLTHHFGSPDMKKKLKKYKIKFQNYSKRRVCECPKDSFGEVEKTDKIYKIKTDKILETFTLEELDKLQHKIRKILGHKLIRLLKVEDGCIELTFRVFNCDDFCISEDQEQALNDLDVLSVTCQNKVVIIQTDKASGINSNSHDSGFHSKEISTNRSSSGMSIICDEKQVIGKIQTDELLSYSKEKDLFDPRIDMMTSAKSERPELQHYSPLYIATQQDNLQLVKQLIENGANPLDKDVNGDTLLHYAAMIGRFDIFKHLVDEVGCNPAIEGYDSRNTLHAAADGNQLHIVRYIIEQCTLDPTHFDHNCKQTALSSACSSGDVSIVRYLIARMLELYMDMEVILYDSYVVTDDYIAHSPLCCACLRGHLSVIKYLVEECKCDITRPEKNTIAPLSAAMSGNHLSVQYLTSLLSPKEVCYVSKKLSLLHRCVTHEKIEILKFLIHEYHCDPNVLFNYYPPLFYACKIGNLDIVKYLISMECDPRASSEYYRAQAIHAAAEGGHLHVVRYLIEEQSCDPSALLENNSTPLHLAAQHGHLAVVHYLTRERHCDPLQVTKLSLDSISYAVLGGNINILNFFLKKCSLHNQERDTPLVFLAAAFGKLNMFKYLVGELKCDPLSRNSKQQDVLHAATMKGQLKMLKYFVEEMKCISNSVDINGNTLLHHSATYGHLHVVQYLVDELKVNIDACDKLGRTPLSVAAAYGHLPVVSYLLEKGSSPIDQHNATPLIYAATKGHLDIVKYLMTSHPNMYFMHPDILPLHMAAMNGKLDVLQYLIDDQHCDPDLGSYEKPINLAAEKGHLNIVKYLVQNCKCDVKSISKRHCTPLHHAAIKGHMNVIHYLIENKANIVCYDVNGNTPLHLAAEQDQLEVVMFLTRKVKRYPFERNHDQQIPLHVALLGHSNISALFLIVTMFNLL